MSILLAATLAAAVQPTCSWDNPGHNPYTGGSAAAIDRYTDIPQAVRITLKQRMTAGEADDQVKITRDAISGKSDYDPQIRDMHFGHASMCATVTRQKWAETRVEPAAVYCVDQHCILVPRICGNVSRITRKTPAVAAVTTQQLMAKDEQKPEIGEADQLDFIDLSGVPISLQQLSPYYDGLDEDGWPILYRAAGINPGDFLSDIEPGIDNDTGRQHQLGTGILLPPDQGIVEAQPVPEADTWAMLLAGISLVGWQTRRRLRKAAAQA